MDLVFYDILSIIAAFQFAFFAVFLLSSRRGNRLSNLLLAGFLACKALATANYFMLRHGLYGSLPYPQVFYLIDTGEFLLSPFLYLYIKSIAYRDFALRRFHLVHMLPFMIWLAYVSVTHVPYGMIPEVFGYTEYLIYQSAILAQLLMYMVLSFRVLNRYGREIRELFSTLGSVKLSWLRVIVTGYIVIWTVSTADFIIYLATGSGIPLLGIAIIGAIFVFANIFVIKGLRQPEIFAGVEERAPSAKYVTSPLTSADKARYLSRIRACMERDKPYLEPNLTLNDLAARAGIPARYISQVINEELGKNFFDFVNGYRIEEAKCCLRDGDGKTILEILYEAGFNSKSVFNAAFRKHTGMTPSEFRKAEVVRSA